jgi:hypothetical protein
VLRVDDRHAVDNGAYPPVARLDRERGIRWWFHIDVLKRFPVGFGHASIVSPHLLKASDGRLPTVVSP